MSKLKSQLQLIGAVGGNLLLYTQGLQFWTDLRLPFHNPWHVRGPLTAARLSPHNNTVGFLILMALAFAFNLGMAWWAFASRPGDPAAPPAPGPGTEPETLRPLWLLSLLLFSLAASAATATYHATGPLLDGFHEGEALAPAMDFLAGKVPYRDTLFLHGLGQDVYRTLAAFALFGRSIAATRIFAGICHMATALGLTGLTVLALPRQRLVATLVVVIVHLAQIPWNAHLPLLILLPRDLIAILWLGCLFGAQRVRGGPALDLLWAALGLLPFLALIYSTDRGVYLLMLAWMILVPLQLLQGLNVSKRRLAFLTLGAMAGAGLLRGLLGPGWEAYHQFMFGMLPTYCEQQFNCAYPMADHAAVLAIVLLYVLAACIAAEAGRALGRHSLKAWAAERLPHLILASLALVFFRSGLGRSDLEHIYYGYSFVLLALASAGIVWLPSGWVHKLDRAPFLQSALLILGAMSLTVPYRNRALADKFPIGRPDLSFLTPEHRATLAYLEDHLRPEDQFLTLTNEGHWYYFLRRPCPLRFHTPWLAGPAPLQSREAATLAGDRAIRYVLAEKLGATDGIDGFPNQSRVPLLFAALSAHYREECRFGRNILYRRVD